MLGKVLALDLRFGRRKYFALAAILVAAGVLLPFVIDLAQFGKSVLFLLGLIIVGILCVVYVVQHYYRNLFGSEGYFMHTLPVRSWQLLLSKSLSAVIWFNFMLFSSGVMVVLIARKGVQWDKFFASFFSDYFPVVVYYFLWANLIILPVILAVYLGLALSTLSLRGKTFGIGLGVAVSVGLSWLALWVISRVMEMPFAYEMAESIENKVLAGFARPLLGLGVSLVFTAAYFLVTNYLIRHRLNLK